MNQESRKNLALIILTITIIAITIIITYQTQLAPPIHTNCNINGTQIHGTLTMNLTNKIGKVICK